MIGYAAGTDLTNKYGNVESIAFVDSTSILLSGDGIETKKRLLPRDDFEKTIDAQGFILRSAKHPHIELTEYQKSTITSRLMYQSILKELVSEGYPATTKVTYDELIKRVESQHPATIATKHPQWKTVCRHWRAWVQSDFNDEALAGVKRNSPIRLNAATEAFVQHHIATVYSCNNSAFKGAYYCNYKREAQKASLNNNEIQITSQRTFYRRLQELTDAAKLANFKGLSQAEINKRKTTLRKRIETYYAMQRVECDRVALNMCLIDDKTGLPTPPISLYVAIDAYTRAPISVVLSFEPENAAGGLNLLRQIFMADSNLTMNGRKPTTLIMDNGPGFNNRLIKKAAERLELNIHYTPSNQPAKKPFIESFFNVLRNQFFSGMKIETQSGETSIGFQSYSGKRTNLNSLDTIPLAKRADIKVSDFTKLLNIFLTEYMHKPHKQAGHTPIEKWNQSIINTPMPSFTYDQLQHCFHVSRAQTSHKLQQRGTIRCLGQDYYSDELKQLYAATKTDMELGENPSVYVFHDDLDARKVTVQATLPGEDIPVEIVAANIDYHDTELPVSFSELNGIDTLTQCGIYQEHFSHTPIGHYAGQITEFVKQKSTRKKRRGPKVASFNKNTTERLSIEERIKKSHNANEFKSQISHSGEQDTYANTILSQTKEMASTRSNDDEGNEKQW
ncbi:hypothetical protein CWC11_06310 [Pseudoalteromonas sp. S3178]|uniref:DDE-type integrase/transposase/recombinase n=1 Tax=Pseudoalteromonas sp. S3178 TaxID=579532 RepID=UPI00110C1BA1|nr:DDE-type integrase/transposase/recombinase [Pseudoalteromonas sp. S3178]TMP07567.1 hypothetical protein CWC11_06310 [Pseudoalteromonas sp. S3178]